MAHRFVGPLAALLLLAPHPGPQLAPAAAAELRLVGLRGATTATANTPEAMRSAVAAMMEQLVRRNTLAAEQVVTATFTATADLDALFPASVARRLPGWDRVALLDMQQLAVRGDLPRCIRVLVLAWLPAHQTPQAVYLGEAARLRPDLAPAAVALPSGGGQDGRPLQPR